MNRVCHIVKWALAGLLVTYHFAKLFQLYGTGIDEAIAPIVHWQSLIRIAVIASLLLVVFRVRYSILAMWISIGGLVATQIFAHFVSAEPSNWLPAFAFLKGLVIPTIITYIHFSEERGMRHAFDN